MFTTHYKHHSESSKSLILMTEGSKGQQFLFVLLYRRCRPTDGCLSAHRCFLSSLCSWEVVGRPLSLSQIQTNTLTRGFRRRILWEEDRNKWEQRGVWELTRGVYSLSENMRARKRRACIAVATNDWLCCVRRDCPAEPRTGWRKLCFLDRCLKTKETAAPYRV